MNSFNSAGSLPIHTAASQISIVDVFFPGFTGISASVQQLLATSTVHVSYYNKVYDMLIAWVSTQPFIHKAHSSLTSVGGMQTRGYTDELSNEYKKKPLRFSPWNGSFFFVYRKHLLRFRCVAKKTKEDIFISCISRLSQILRDLLSECRADYLKLIQKKTTVFEHHDGEWRKAKTRDIRPILTVIMDEDEKTAVLKDIEGFLDKRARGWYARRGIPYQRSFLLYEPPGTGKFSFSLSVAGCFELDIYVLNEDINAAGTSRTEVSEMTENTGQGVAGPSQRKSQGNVSLSALLNALDDLREFAAKILDHLFSSVEILLSFLLERKQSPTDALADVDSWVAKASKERGKMENYVRARAIANPTDSFEDLAESSRRTTRDPPRKSG
ncbi:hypothetical protein ACJ73_02542 [Blastomyces percursus]|uniref:BCS1 N-terminal domain-containing protein n=1 Tax=Blastomyces percursus TaxID=1658174 RepID=A0A1J9QC34_9EURO|nr:hypothetical protein ACJ73_02542 [Blastomyces percursus]